MAGFEVWKHPLLGERIVTQVPVSERVRAVVEDCKSKEELRIERTRGAGCDNPVPNAGWRTFASAFAINWQRRHFACLSRCGEIAQQRPDVPINVDAVRGKVVHARAELINHRVPVSRLLASLPVVFQGECRCHTYENYDQLERKFPEQRAMFDHMSAEP